MGKAPAFQFYPNDFLGGVVASYSLEEIGLYTVLLAFDWNLSGLPLDVEKLAKLSRVSLRKFRVLWETVGENFVERDGRYFNPRLQLERAKQEEWRRKSSDGGKKGAANRGSRVVEPPYQPNGNTPTPSPSPTPEEQEQSSAGACAFPHPDPLDSDDGRLLAAQLGDEDPRPVLEFISERPIDDWGKWCRSSLQIMGPSTGILPSDLTGAFSDALMVNPRADTPVAIRAFARRRREERLRQDRDDGGAIHGGYARTSSARVLAGTEQIL